VLRLADCLDLVGLERCRGIKICRVELMLVDPKVFGLGIAAHVRMRAMPGQVKKVAQMLLDTPQVVEADRVTGEDCFLAKVVVCSVRELETVIDRFLPFSSTDTAIIQLSIVVRGLPKL
jgi:Lrp/AsnC family leucine-responsive transcriptional regulator